MGEEYQYGNTVELGYEDGLREWHGEVDTEADKVRDTPGYGMSDKED